MAKEVNGAVSLKTVISLCVLAAGIPLGAVSWVRGDQSEAARTRQELCERVAAVEVSVDHVQKTTDSINTEVKDLRTEIDAGFKKVIEAVEKP